MREYRIIFLNEEQEKNIVSFYNHLQPEDHKSTVMIIVASREEFNPMIEGLSNLIFWVTPATATKAELFRIIEKQFLSLTLSNEDKVVLEVGKMQDERALSYLIKGIELIPDHFIIRQDTSLFSVSDELNDEQLLQIAHEHLEQYNAKAILDLFPQVRIPGSIQKLVSLYDKIHTLSFTKGDRQLFAEVIELQRTHHLNGESPGIERWQGLLDGKQEVFIPFLYHQMIRFFHEHNYIDYLVRHYRLIEELFIFALGWDINRTGVPIIKRANAWRPLLPREKLLHRHLETEFIKMVKKQNKGNRLYDYLQIRNVRLLIKLRHEGVGGHGFKEIDRDVIDQIFRENDLHLELAQIITEYGLMIGTSPYEQLSKLILLEIESYLQNQMNGVRV